MVNPAFPKKQLVGVYSLELSRLYSYLYQQSSTQFAIVHSLDGYDEVSLTGDFKYILNGVEQIASPEGFGFERISQQDLFGGSTVQDAADIFSNVLNGKGTLAQQSVVIANSQMALMCYFPKKSIPECRQLADESLKSGKALEAFTKLINMQP
jgi:anthranilate phosphoribosyltransferase